MAYYAALASLQSTLEKFIGQDPLQILDDEYTKQRFDILQRNVALLLDFLDNFPGSAPQLEKKIALSAEEAECMIEKYVWQNREKREEVSFLYLSKLLPLVRLTAITIKSILRELEEIKTKAIAGDGSRSKGESPDLSGIRKTTDEVLGFDDELARVKDLILYGGSEMVAVPIVGMGGVGKTTLAKAAFDDHAVVRHFDVRRWVTVSQAYDSKAILLTILNKKSSNETASLQQLSVEVHQLLHRRRFIIVVDDVWSLDAWDNVKRFFPDNNNGSRILLTTRDEAVASYADVSSTAIHHLGLMDEERSWRLLEQRLFGEGVCCPPELVEVGKKIAQGCKGLPLAIVVVVGILSTIEQTPDSWKIMAGDVNMALSKGPGEYFSEILSLSYHHLPHFLKPCFLYFSAFPEDDVIDVEKVIRLWVAEGFLRASKPAKLAEEIAYGCLEDLTKRNLIMVSKKRYDGKITDCRIHDLLRELCIRQAEEQKFICHNRGKIFSEGLSKARRISITSYASSRPMNPGESFLHTTFCFVQDSDFMYRLMWVPWKLLRVLDMKAFEFRNFPIGLSQLYHLRYLAFTYTYVERLYIPEYMSNLENLETFMVDSQNPYPEVPFSFLSFWKMKNLRHAVINDVRLPDPISQKFPLENLFTLSKLHNFRCSKWVVELIPNLKTIDVVYNLDWEDRHYYHLNNFARFRNLESFTIEFRFKSKILSNPFVDWLVIPSSLRRLTIVRCRRCILWEGISAAIGSLPNLEYLKFKYVQFCGDVWETREGDFQNLRELEMHCVTLQRWKTESSSHFPNLERLVMRSCDNLAEVPDCIGDIATLQLINVYNCLEVVNEWARTIREEQREMGNEILEIVVNDMKQ